MAETIGDSLLLNLLKELRAEQRDHRTPLLQGIDYSRRIERRVAEMRDDLELTVKSELMGRLGHFETQVEMALGKVADRMDAMARESAAPKL